MQQEFHESGPGAGAEKVFANDPEMLAMVRAERERIAREGPAMRKPMWWQALMVLLGLAWAGAATVPAILEVVPFHPLLPASGLFGGMCLSLGILGHRPGRWIIRDERTGSEEKATLWKRMPIMMRLGAFAVWLVAPAAAVGLLLLQ
ncbi:MAG: hypothetical protein ACXVEF_21110 [Polyangiales bacterium]